MPAKTVTLSVVALTEEANRRIAATGAYFQKLKDANPATLEVKLDRLQAIAQSKIIAQEMSQTVRDTVKLDLDRSLGSGLITGLLSRGGSGGILGLVGRAGGGGLGAAGIGGLGALGVPALGGLAAGALGIIPALVAAGAGVAAFGALAIPTFTAVTGAISGVSAANAKFTEAAQNVDIAIRTSAADAKLYNDALAKMPANLASAAKLLGDQSVTWQGLTTSQQNNIIALSQNKSALASLLPAQRTALTQLLNSKAVWDQLSPAQQKVATGWQNISSAFQAMATKLAPTVLTIMASALQAINTVLPSILPLAQAAGTALGGLFTSLDKAVASKGFGDFIKQLTALSGPAITAIGTGIGQIAAALGKLLLALASPSAIRDLKVFLEIVAGAINVLADFFNFATPRWNNNLRSFNNFTRVITRFFTSTLPTAFDIVKESARIAFDELEIAGLKAALGITTAFGHLPGPLGAPFRQASTAIRHELANVQADVTNAVNNITADWNKLNGLTANLNVAFHINPGPGGSTSINPFTRRYAGGTSSATPGWAWVGEQGAELVRFRGGETVIPSSVAGGYAGGTGRNAQIDELIAAVNNLAGLQADGNQISAQAPAIMGAALAGSARSAAYGALYP